MTIKLIEYMPDNYAKFLDSNNVNLLGIVDAELNEMLEMFQVVEKSRNIDNATFATLDKAGKNALEYRGGQDDDRFRDIIKIKMRAIKSAGDLLTIGEIANALLGDTILNIQEAWDSGAYDNEPAAILIRLRGNELRYIPIPLEMVVAGGIRVLYEINLINNVGIEARRAAWLFNYVLTDTLLCGTHPVEAILGKVLKSMCDITADLFPHKFDYNLCGTNPTTKTKGHIEKTNLNTTSELEAARFLYPPTGELLCGTYPAA